MSGENNEAYIYNKGLRDFIAAVAGGGSTQGVEVWYGPYTITYQTPDLASEVGHQLFTPNIGDWMIGVRFLLREPFVCPEGGYPRLSFGFWGDSGVDIFGSDVTFSVGVDDRAVAVQTSDFLLSGTQPQQFWPGQFLSESPVYVNIIDGGQDLSGLDKPGPAYTQAPTAGDVDFYFKIVSGSIP